MERSFEIWKSIHGNAFAGAKVLITGGAGFIGSHIASALARLGAKVVALDDLSGGATGDFTGLGPIQFVRGSILDEQLLEEHVAGCKYVFHQAALGSVPGSVREPRRYYDVN